ncbi:hypothetical protein CFC21_009787 [Triticum aestivum]|uniref:DUF4220 domain-containing protein n=2 Tax=Triticum aestivum TaxID=4565 RepID=A0A9R1DJ98_WHEAT|nr:hypothetical protein CFC21_009787 [Triticum aestivum]
MDSSTKLFNEWEIQILVLLSFTLQLFLFFSGRLRRQSSSGFLRLSTWAAYLGADLAAVYALGYLSKRQYDTTETNILTRTQPLAIFWAPFLLIHLGGQDTITAFAMEDNNLWLRHLLNLVTQVVIALYVFWKSIGKHSANLLLAGSFVFVAGIIKYGERTWSLKCGSLKSLESTDAKSYRKKLPEGISDDDGFVRAALDSMHHTIDILSERSMFGSKREELAEIDKTDQVIRMVKLQLGMMYDDLYTKALVFTTRTGVILRCISQASIIVAFALFLANDKERYNKADTIITYSLFAGCFFLEVCSIFVSMMSPWTWTWLKVHKWDTLAWFSWFVFHWDIGYPRMEQQWPNAIGQYNFHGWVTNSNLQPRTHSQRIMMVFRKFVGLFGVQKRKIFWMSKLLDTEYMDADNMIVEYIVKEISLLNSESDDDKAQGWQSISSLVKTAMNNCLKDFGYSIVVMHLFTEAHLEQYVSFRSDIETNRPRADVPFGLMEVCRKLSNYMMYLLVHHPSMLPLSMSATASFDNFHKPENAENACDELELKASKETLEELTRMWTRLLVYAAGKSRAAMHAAQLSGGGELITFAWLLMAHMEMGDTGSKRFHLTTDDFHAETNLTNRYLFCVPPEDQTSGPDNRSEIR